MGHSRAEKAKTHERIVSVPSVWPAQCRTNRFVSEREGLRGAVRAYNQQCEVVVRQILRISLGDFAKQRVNQFLRLDVAHKLLIEKLKLHLPSQSPPRLVAQKDSSEIEVQTVR